MVAVFIEFVGCVLQRLVSGWHYVTCLILFCIGLYFSVGGTY